MRLAQVNVGYGYWWENPIHSALTLEYWQSWGAWAVAHQVPLLLGLIIFLLIVEMRVLRKRLTADRGWWRGKMTQLYGAFPKLTQKQRKAFLDQLQEDILVEGIEAAVYEGKLTRSEASKIYTKMALYAGLKGLAPRTDQEKLKRELQYKRAEKSEAKTELGNVFLKAAKSTA